MNLRYFEIFASVLGSSILTALISSFINRKKTKAEIESIVVDTYKDMVSDLRAEMTRMKEQIKELSERELLYIENQNLLLKDKQELSKRVASLEAENKTLISENHTFKERIKELENKFKNKN